MRMNKGTVAALILSLLLPVAASAAKKPAPPVLTEAEVLMNHMDTVNQRLSSQGANYRLYIIETLTTSADAGITVFARNLGNKQLSHHFVPGDPRREWNTGSSITWTVDGTADNAYAPLVLADIEGAFDRAVGTWQDVACSDIPLEKVASVGDVGYVEAATCGNGGSFDIYADITFGGFGQVDCIQGANVLATTYTLIWVDDNSNPTDVDRNGKADTAFREIYFKGGWNWNINATYDIETVALHEFGHGISQGHFGTIFLDGGQGNVHFAPRAVMNAAYSGIQQQIAETDNAGHCSIWAQWPNN